MRGGRWRVGRRGELWKALEGGKLCETNQVEAKSLFALLWGPKGTANSRALRALWLIFLLSFPSLHSNVDEFAFGSSCETSDREASETETSSHVLHFCMTELDERTSTDCLSVEKKMWKLVAFSETGALSIHAQLGEGKVSKQPISRTCEQQGKRARGCVRLE